MTNLDQLAVRAGVPAASVAAWTALGLLDVSADGRYRDDALARARLLRLATARGVSAQAIAVASERHGDLLGRFAAAADVPTGLLSVQDAADRAGLPVELARRLHQAAGLDDDGVAEDDLAAMRAARTALDAGVPSSALAQLLRVYADALCRVADAEVRLFHLHVHDAPRPAARDAADATVRTDQATGALMELFEPAVVYFHRKAWRRAIVDDALAHLADEVSTGRAPGELPVAVLFVDLAGFTPLTEVMGDEAAADVVDRFSDLVRDEARHCDGRVVKQIGDEFMLVFPDARTAVFYALHLAATASVLHEFPALRIGIHVGAAIYRAADYFGATVNMAARVAGRADSGQLVVTEMVHAAAQDIAAWTALGLHELKGIGGPVELFAAELARSDLPVDPMCGMTVNPARAVRGDDGDG